MKITTEKGERMMEETIVACQRNVRGEIINFQTSSGRIISYRKAVEEIKEGILSGMELNYMDESNVPLIQYLENSDYQSIDDLPTL